MGVLKNVNGESAFGELPCCGDEPGDNKLLGKCRRSPGAVTILKLDVVNAVHMRDNKRERPFQRRTLRTGGPAMTDVVYKPEGGQIPPHKELAAPLFNPVQRIMYVGFLQAREAPGFGFRTLSATVPGVRVPALLTLTWDAWMCLPLQQPMQEGIKVSARLVQFLPSGGLPHACNIQSRSCTMFDMGTYGLGFRFRRRPVFHCGRGSTRPAPGACALRNLVEPPGQPLPGGVLTVGGISSL